VLPVAEDAGVADAALLPGLLAGADVEEGLAVEEELAAVLAEGLLLLLAGLDVDLLALDLGGEEGGDGEGRVRTGRGSRWAGGAAIHVAKEISTQPCTIHWQDGLWQVAEQMPSPPSHPTTNALSAFALVNPKDRRRRPSSLPPPFPCL